MVPRRTHPVTTLAALALSSSLFCVAQRAPGYAPGRRTQMDAHNCYPYEGRWKDRIGRALSAGAPVAIEQDLSWYTDPRTGKSWSVVAHSHTLTGQEPTLEFYFFQSVRPLVEQALREHNTKNWPLITLNLDFKDNKPEHLQYIWKVLEKYQGWLTTAPRTASIETVAPLHVGPILVLTGDPDAQQKVFYDDVPVGGRLLVFGAVHTDHTDPMAPPAVLEPGAANNYRRWWNNPWNVVEQGGQNKAGPWTPADATRLKALVAHAHGHGLWIRFYTLDGAPPATMQQNGWFESYNFGSLARARTRWQAAYRAHVDYIATDQYRTLAESLRTMRSRSSR
jgi:hypothetical protein